MQGPGNLIANDSLVSSIFAAIADADANPLEKLWAIARAGKIAEAYLPPHTTEVSRAAAAKAFSAKTS